MVVIRLARRGAKHSPFYHVTVADKRARRDGAFIERIGFYNPIASGDVERLKIDLDRLAYWQGVGAQTSQRVQQLIREAKKMAAAQPATEAETAEEVKADTEVTESTESEEVSATQEVEAKADDVSEDSEASSDESQPEAESESTAEQPAAEKE